MTTNNIIQILRSEHLKVKRNIGVGIILLFSIAMAVLVMVYLMHNYADLKGEIFLYNPWQILLGRYTFQFYPLFFPIVISIVCHSLCNIEYQNNSYKLIFTLPFDKSKLYIAKVILLLEIILISCLIIYVLYLGSGNLLSIIMPNYQFQHFENRDIIFAFFIKLFLSLVSIASVQLFISLAFKNFAVSISTASFATICSLLFAKDYPILFSYIPHYSTNKVLYSFFQEIISFERYNVICIATAILFFVGGYYIFKNKSKRV